MADTPTPTPTRRTSVPTALDIALGYHQAWSDHDMERAMDHIANDIVCRSPAGELVGVGAFRAFMEPFAASVSAAPLLAAYGEADQVLVLYDTTTPLVASAPGAELVTVVDGRITAMTIVFDRLPFHLAREAAAAGTGDGR